MVVKMQKTEEVIRQDRQRLKEKVLLLNKNSAGDTVQSLEELYGVGEDKTAASGTAPMAPQSTSTSRSEGAVGGFKQSRPGGRQQSGGGAAAPPPQPPSLSTGKDSSIVKTYSTTEKTRRTYTGGRADERHKSADTLNLDEFLVATHKVEAPRRVASNPANNAAKVKKDDTASSYF